MKVAIIAGSNRKQSTSTQLCRYIQSELRNRGCEVTLHDLYERPLPWYTPDEEPQDGNLRDFVQAVTEAEAVVIATPEYHGSVSGVLKNALDFLSREQMGGKPVLSVSSAGGAVGTSSLLQMQAMMRNLHAVNCSEWISLGRDQQQFDDAGVPVHGAIRGRVEQALDQLLRLAEKLR